MNEMTPAARQQLDDYLQRMRTALRGARPEVAEEVEQSVREHIEIALEEWQEPASGTQMIAILDRLGPPEQWLDEDERPTWRRAIDGVSPRTDESRLPYVSFGLVLASILLFMMFGFLLLIPAMFVSRAWIEQKRERGETLGSKRWLVYPAIAIVFAFASLVFLVVPPQAAMAFIRDDAGRLFDIPTSPAGQLRFMAGLRCVMFGSWWIIAGGLCAALMRPIRFVFSPLLDGLQRRHYAVLAAIGALLAAAGGALIYYRH